MSAMDPLEARDAILAHLAAAGLLAAPLPDDELLLGEESIEELEREIDVMADQSTTPWGLAAAVVEDRG